jgi:hypothetical protein
MRNCWSSRLSEVVFLILLSPNLYGQFSPPDSISPVPARAAEKYMFPILPGKTAMLTGTMGELRSTHFHGGLDINTVTIGYAVRCANDGYVASVRMGTSGYGNCIMVRHPDGRTTLYAHLDRLKGKLAEHVRAERYRRKQSEIELSFEPGKFPVSKGDTLALSGNTGSSGGPHLHFELRDENNEAINPLVLGFDEVQDHVPPQLKKIALRTLDTKSRINDQFGRFEFNAVRRGSNWSLPQPILATGRIGVEVQAVDKAETSTFRFGINLIEVYADSNKIFSQKIDKINFDESRTILAVMDYPTLEQRGARFNKLYIDDGNRLPYYSGTVGAGTIKVEDKDVDIAIHLVDFHGNRSVIALTLRPSQISTEAAFMMPSKQSNMAEIRNGILTFSSNFCAGSSSDTLLVYSKGAVRQMHPSYSGKTRNIYLIDLRSEMPDSLVSCSGSWVSNFKARVPSGIGYKYYSDEADVEFPAGALYDTLFLATRYDSASGETFTIGSEMTALHMPVRITLKPRQDQIVTRNLGVYRLDGRGYDYLQATWKNGKVSFSAISLGKFTLLRDSIPPTIKPLNINGASARLRIRDDLSGISYFEASINGEWLLMNYDHKTGVVYAERLDTTRALKGDFTLKVVDQAGNESIHQQRIPQDQQP